MGDIDDEFIKLKQSFDDVMTTFNLKGKTHSQISANGSYKRDLLAEAFVSVADICQKALGMYENRLSTPSTIDNIVSKVTNVVSNMVPSLVNDVLKSSGIGKAVDNTTSKSMMSENDKHIIIVEDKNDISKTYDDNSWSQVIRSSLNGKLKSIPVQKSLVTKAGQGCLFFPTKDDQQQAQSVLEQDYTVSLSTKKKQTLLPKLKILKIDDVYKREDKEVLKMAILEKNAYIKTYVKDGHHFEIIIIDEKYNYCIAKVSPEIREAVMKRAKIYIDMESHDVKDQFHIIQCFRCQEHGHKNGDDMCKLSNSDDTICLYCCSNHSSKTCPNKKNVSKWKCSNCANSKNPEHKLNSEGHTSTSNNCPFVIMQTKSLINRTKGLDVKNFFQ